MELYSIQNIPSPHGKETVVKDSALNSFLFTALLFFLTLGCLVFAYYGGYRDHGVDLPPAVLYWIGGVLGIITLISRFHYQARLRPSNWLVRLRPDQILIKFRSYLNDHFPVEDPVVVALPFSEIEWVRKTREKLIQPTCSEPHREQVSWHTYLDVKMNGLNAKKLKEVLITEINREAPKSKVDALKHELFQARKRKAPQPEINRIKQDLKTEHSRKNKKMRGSGTIFHHYPVRMVDPDILRVEWGGNKPGIKEILSTFRGQLKIEPELSIKTDHTEKQERQDLDHQILDLAERGKIMEAISVVRHKYGFSLKRSKEFVAELRKA